MPVGSPITESFEGDSIESRSSGGLSDVFFAAFSSFAGTGPGAGIVFGGAGAAAGLGGGGGVSEGEFDGAGARHNSADATRSDSEVRVTARPPLRARGERPKRAPPRPRLPTPRGVRRDSRCSARARRSR